MVKRTIDEAGLDGSPEALERIRAARNAIILSLSDDTVAGLLETYGSEDVGSLAQRAVRMAAELNDGAESSLEAEAGPSSAAEAAPSTAEAEPSTAVEANTSRPRAPTPEPEVPEEPEDKECLICQHELGDQREDNTIEAGIRVPTCGHYFGYRCLAKATQRNPTCPMCRGEIPQQILKDLKAIHQQDEEHGGAHTAAACPHDRAEDMFYGLVYDPLEHDGSTTVQSFDVEYAPPLDYPQWTYLFCPGVNQARRNHLDRQIHFNEIVIAVGSAMSKRVIPTGNRNEFFAGVWYGPQSYNTRRQCKNKVWRTTARSEHTAIADAITMALTKYQEYLILESRDPGGKIIIKTDNIAFCKIFSEYINQWRENDYRTFTGKPVRHKSSWKAMDEIVQSLRRNQRVQIYVWEVEVDQVQSLDQLLRLASDRWDYEEDRLPEPERVYAKANEVWKSQRQNYFRRDAQLQQPNWMRAQQQREQNFNDQAVVGE